MEQIEDSRSFAEVVVHTVLISQAMVLSLLGNSLFCLAFIETEDCEPSPIYTCFLLQWLI